MLVYELKICDLWVENGGDWQFLENYYSYKLPPNLNIIYIYFKLQGHNLKLREMMIPKRHKRVYDKIKFGIKKKEKAVKKLSNRRKQLETTDLWIAYELVIPYNIISVFRCLYLSFVVVVFNRIFVQFTIKYVLSMQRKEMNKLIWAWKLD